LPRWSRRLPWRSTSSAWAWTAASAATRRRSSPACSPAAGELGLHLVAHAGEEGPPAYIESALDVLQVERIDHGVRCTESPALVQRLARQPHAADGVPAVEREAVRVQHHGRPQPAGAAGAGLCATVNSDDPAYFGGYMNQNFVETFAALPQLGATEAWALARNSFEASFATPAQKAAWVSRAWARAVQARGAQG
jgi:adenosine deaminase